MPVIKVSDIIEWAKKEGFSFDFIGSSETTICGFSSLRRYKRESLTWINYKNPVGEEVLPMIRCAVIQKGVDVHLNNYFVTEESKKFFFGILEHFFSKQGNDSAERANSYIGESVKLGKNVRIGCSCVLDGDITIGDNTVIGHNVTMINRISIGSDCFIHSGTSIGKDGFGFWFGKNNIPQKVPHFGGVPIGDRVEIGCNCVIDRGTIDDTTIGDDTKIDNLVLIAHNVSIGKGCLIVGVSDIAGSSNVGDYSYIGPQVCVENKRNIGNNSFVGMGVMVHEDLSDNMCIVKNGTSPFPNKNYRRFL